jgi:cytochrome o ubiquinol oxidase subunit 2
VWWALPSLLILVLSIVTWNSSHALDPYKRLDSVKKPLQVQVVSLNWKWLFIYPEQNIASVNEMYVPVDTPVDIRLTSDATMNSFWIPQLAGQIYTMPGMVTQLHLMADREGAFRGQSANISGEGFAGMNFYAYAAKQPTFDKWVASVRSSHGSLDEKTYTKLVQPTQNVPVTHYASVDGAMFDAVMNKYMSPDGAHGMHAEAME